MKEETTNKIVVIILVVSFIANVIAIWALWPKHQQLGEPTIEVVYDTIPIYYRQPIPVDSTVIRYVDVSLPISESVKDTVYITTTDSIKVQIPITQKVYSDSTYKAWVSGFHPALDSIYVYQPSKTITVNQPIIEYKTKHWGVGIQAGAGITPSRIEPYIGIGVTYNILSW